MIFPYVDRATTHVLADHIRDGYPTYTPGEIDTAVTTYLVILSVIGVLGVISWLWTAQALKAGKRWARSSATAIFVVAACIALASLVTKDTSGEVGLAPLLGWITALPCLAGLVAVTLLWKRPRTADIMAS